MGEEGVYPLGLAHSFPRFPILPCLLREHGFAGGGGRERGSMLKVPLLHIAPWPLLAFMKKGRGPFWVVVGSSFPPLHPCKPSSRVSFILSPSPFPALSYPLTQGQEAWDAYLDAA